MPRVRKNGKPWTPPKQWTDDEDRLLEAAINAGKSVGEVAAILGRTSVHSVQARISRLHAHLIPRRNAVSDRDYSARVSDEAERAMARFKVVQGAGKPLRVARLGDLMSDRYRRMSEDIPDVWKPATAGPRR